MPYYWGYNKFVRIFQKASQEGLLSKKVKGMIKEKSKDTPEDCVKYIEYFDPKPQPDMEPIIAKDGGSSAMYSRITGKRFEAGEPAIVQQGGWEAILYAKDTIKGRWPEAEAKIAEHPWLALRYMTNVVNYRKRNKTRIPELEQGILQNTDAAIEYAKKVLKGRWPEAEGKILSQPSWAYRYAKKVTGPIPEVVEVVKDDPKYAYKYAKDVLRGRFPEGEAAITRRSGESCWYAYYVLHGRFPAGEPRIKKSRFAAWYAMNVIKGRWPEAELDMASKTNTWSGKYYAEQYARQILHDPTPTTWAQRKRQGLV